MRPALAVACPVYSRKCDQIRASKPRVRGKCQNRVGSKNHVYERARVRPPHATPQVWGRCPSHMGIPRGPDIAALRRKRIPKVQFPTSSSPLQPAPWPPKGPSLGSGGPKMMILASFPSQNCTWSRKNLLVHKTSSSQSLAPPALRRG